MSDDFKLPLVAVVTPVYNGASFLSETMACVQAQTYDNLVHFVLDNASTDETPAIIEHFKNGRVPVIAQRNSETIGVKDNWETATPALELSNGIYDGFGPAQDRCSTCHLALCCLAEALGSGRMAMGRWVQSRISGSRAHFEWLECPKTSG